MIAYIFFRFVVFIFRWMPFWFLYALSNGLYYVLYYVVRYRRGVVRSNMQGAFADKRMEELKQLERAFYRHLCDILLEGIKGLTMSKAEITRRYTLHNPELVNSFYREGRSFIALGTHCGNWEWGAIGTTLQVEPPLVILFNPIKNQRINTYIQQSRELYRTFLRPIQQTKAIFETFLPKPHVFIFIADQNPSNVRDAHWVNLFNRPTAMLHGAAKYAQLYDLPLVFFTTHRTRRGYYAVHPEIMLEKPNSVTPLEITQAYARRLEALIRQYPSDWLWSHRRWKHKPPQKNEA